MKTELTIGSKLYYIEGQYCGEVVKVLKQTVWVKNTSGDIEKNVLISQAKEMLK